MRTRIVTASAVLLSVILMVLIVPVASEDSDAATEYRSEVTLDLDEPATIDLADHMSGKTYEHTLYTQYSGPGDLPPGMSLDGRVVSGTPTEVGTYDIQFRFYNGIIAIAYDAYLHLRVTVEDIPEHYTVTYDAGVGLVNGVGTWSERIVESSYASLPDARHSSGAYTFIGWSLSETSTITVDSLIVTSDVTLHAVWERNTVLIGDLSATVTQGQSATLRVSTDPSNATVSVSSYGGLSSGNVRVDGHTVRLDMSRVPAGTYYVTLSASYTGYYTGSSTLTIDVPIVIVEPIAYTLSVGDVFSYTPVTDPSNATIAIHNIRIGDTDLADTGPFSVDGRTITGIPKEPGTYEITYIASLQGYEEVSDTVILYIHPSSQASDPVALSSVIASSRADEPRVFDFVAIGGSNVSNYVWSIDGTVFASSSETALYEFYAPGIYTVDCTAHGRSGDSVTVSVDVVCSDSYHRDAAWDGVAYGMVMKGTPSVRVSGPFSVSTEEIDGTVYTVVSGTPSADDIGRSYSMEVDDGTVDSWDVTVYERQSSAPTASFLVDIDDDGNVRATFTGMNASFHTFDFDSDGVPDGDSFVYADEGVHVITCTAVNNVSQVTSSMKVVTGPDHREETTLDELTDFQMGVGEELRISILTGEGDVLSVSGTASSFTVVDGSGLIVSPVGPGVFDLTVTMTRSDGTEDSRTVQVTVKDHVDFESRSNDYMTAMVVLFVIGIASIAAFLIFENRDLIQRRYRR